MGSTRVLDGFYKSSGWALQGFCMGSTRVLYEFYKDSVRFLQGLTFYKGSVWVLTTLLTIDSLRSGCFFGGGGAASRDRDVIELAAI